MTHQTKQGHTRIWIVPINDAEAVAIATYLERHGQTVFRSQQPWGASWKGLEPAIGAAVADALAAPNPPTVHGVELAGPNPYHAIDIDHHRYQNDDRSHPLSSLEQVATIVGHPLDRREQLIAANDRAYIPGMKALGATDPEIEAVRQLDRAAQGITPADEARAVADLARAERRGARIHVACSAKPTSAHMDRLYGQAPEILLTSEHEWNYSGPRHLQLAAANFPEQHWSGGSPESGYFGILDPAEPTRGAILDFFWSGETSVPDLARAAAARECSR